MNGSHQQEAAIFDAAMELPPEQRSPYVDQACGGDAGLRQRIECLFDASESRREFLDPAAALAAAAPTGAAPPAFEKLRDQSCVATARTSLRYHPAAGS